MLTEKELALIHAVGINVNKHDHPALFEYLCNLLLRGKINVTH